MIIDPEQPVSRPPSPLNVKSESVSLAMVFLPVAVALSTLNRLSRCLSVRSFDTCNNRSVVGDAQLEAHVGGLVARCCEETIDHVGAEALGFYFSSTMQRKG